MAERAAREPTRRPARGRAARQPAAAASAVLVRVVGALRTEVNLGAPRTQVAAPVRAWARVVSTRRAAARPEAVATWQAGARTAAPAARVPALAARALARAAQTLALVRPAVAAAIQVVKEVPP